MFRRILQQEGRRYFTGASKKYSHGLFRVLKHQHDFQDAVPTVLEKGRKVMAVAPVESLEGGVFVHADNTTNCFYLMLQDNQKVKQVEFYDVVANANGLKGTKNYGPDTSLTGFFIDKDKLVKTGNVDVQSHDQVIIEEATNKIIKK